MLIGFEFIWDETPLLIEVAKKLQKNGHEIIGVTLCSRWNLLLKDTGFTLVNLGNYLETQWNTLKISEELLQEYEDRYGKEHDLWFFINVDRLISEVNKKHYRKLDDKLKFLIHHFKFWEKFFAEHDVDGFYTTGTAFLGLLAGVAVALNQQKHLKGIYTTRDSKARIVFTANYYDNWDSINKEYEKLLTKGLSAEQEEYARDTLQEFREKSQKPSYMKYSWDMSGFRIPFIREFIRRLKYRYIYKWGTSKFDYVTPPVFRRVLLELKVICKRKLLALFYFSKKKVSNKRFILFPLQLQPEESIDIWGRWYSNQVTAIENISGALPLNHYLIVKEHKVALGRRPGIFCYYNKLKRLANVILVDPFADSHELIRKADLVIVISGTVGWEALLYGKPVITLGNVFYNDSGLVTHVENISELKSAITRLLDNYQLDEDKLLTYLTALREGTYEGYFNVPHTDPRVNDPKNIENVAEAILKDIQSE